MRFAFPIHSSRFGNAGVFAPASMYNNHLFGWLLLFLPHPHTDRSGWAWKKK
jgi:hypothetical protein